MQGNMTHLFARRIGSRARTPQCSIFMLRRGWQSETLSYQIRRPPSPQFRKTCPPARPCRRRSSPRRARTPSWISRGEGTGGGQGQARIAASMWSSRPRRPYARIFSSPKDQRGILAQGGRHSEGMSQRRGSGNGIRLCSS